MSHVCQALTFSTSVTPPLECRCGGLIGASDHPTTTKVVYPSPGIRPRVFLAARHKRSLRSTHHSDERTRTMDVNGTDTRSESIKRSDIRRAASMRRMARHRSKNQTRRDTWH